MPERYEHLLFRYSSALERGDFEAVADVLREAERDPALEAMLLELNEVYAAEQTGRFNHKNPKELAMIAPLYEKRAPERVRTYNLPMVAALAVVMLLGVLLATRIAPPTQWNTAQNGSPEPNVAQGVPDECERSGSAVPRLQLYSRPSTDARMIHEYVGLYVPQSALVQVDSAEAEGQSWYFVSISDGVAETQGWITADAYNQNVRCAPLVNAEILTRAVEEGKLTGTPTLAPFEERTVVATALPPTMVPPEMMMTATPMPFDANMPTLIPADMQGIAMFTATPVPFDMGVPTVVPADVRGLTTFTPTPAPFDGSMPTALPTSTPFPLNGDAPPLMNLPEEVPFVPTVVPTFPEPYPVYEVQEGDTVYSILSQFNLSGFSMDELTFINNLPSDVTELPETLLIPVATGMQLLTCVVDADESVDLFPYPAAGEATGLLQSGTVFRVVAVTEEVNERWYLIMAQMGHETTQDVWVNAEAVSQRSDCVRFLPIPENLTPVPFELTATPMPTVLPPSATPTPAQ